MEAHIIVELPALCHGLEKLACVVARAQYISDATILRVVLPTINQHVTLAHLYDLDVTLFPETKNSYLSLSRLRLPRLRRLRLCVTSPSEGEMPHFISQFGSLMDLRLSGYKLTPNRMLGTLELTPGLVSLDLDVRANFEEICQAMVNTPLDAQCVPLLKGTTLRLEPSDIPSFSSKAFANMIRFRQANVRPSAEPASYIHRVSLLVPSANESVLDEIRCFFGETSSGEMPEGKYLDTTLRSIVNINLVSY